MRLTVLIAVACVAAVYVVGTVVESTDWRGFRLEHLWRLPLCLPVVAVGAVLLWPREGMSAFVLVFGATVTMAAVSGIARWPIRSRR